MRRVAASVAVTGLIIVGGAALGGLYLFGRIVRALDERMENLDRVFTEWDDYLEEGF